MAVWVNWSPFREASLLNRDHFRGLRVELSYRAGEVNSEAVAADVENHSRMPCA
jgi:hypothetical protein